MTIKTLTEEQIQNLYSWIDEIPLTRPKRNISRDFSDGVPAAEVLKHFLPKLVDLHNYPAASSSTQKLYNWNTLNHKVLRKIGYALTDDMITNIVNAKPGYIELFLHDLRQKVESYISTRKSQSLENLNDSFSSNSNSNVYKRNSMANLAPKTTIVKRAPNKKSLPPLKTQSPAERIRSATSAHPKSPYHETQDAPTFQQQPFHPQQFAQPPPLPPQQIGSMAQLPMLPPQGHPLIQAQFGPPPQMMMPPQFNTVPVPMPPQPIAAPQKKSARGVQQVPLGQNDEKDQAIRQLQETIQILQLKSSKLEHLLMLKDQHIQELTRRLEHGQ